MAKKVKQFFLMKAVDLTHTKQNVRVKKHFRSYVEVIVTGRKRDLPALWLSRSEPGVLQLVDDPDYALPSSTGNYVQGNDAYATGGSVAGLSSGGDITINWDGAVADIVAAGNVDINGRRIQSAGKGKLPTSLRVTVKVPRFRQHACRIVGR